MVIGDCDTTSDVMYCTFHFIQSSLCRLCLAVSWDVGEWSECSRRCGPGTQQRQVICRQVTHVHLNGTETSVPVAPELCGSSDRPVTKSTCQLKICSQWEIQSEWSPVRRKHTPLL